MDWRYLDLYERGGVQADGVLWDVDRRYRTAHLQAEAEREAQRAERTRAERLETSAEQQAGQKWRDLLPEGDWAPEEVALLALAALAAAALVRSGARRGA